MPHLLTTQETAAMANTNFTVNDPLAVKLWAKKLAVQAIQQTWFRNFISDDGNNVIYLMDDAEKSAGDTVNVGLRTQLAGAGVQGDGTLEGQEEALTTYADKLLIDQLRHAVNVGGRMTQQRVPFELREEARMGLQDWWAARFDLSFFNQLCGYTVQADTRYTGNNARRRRPGSSCPTATPRRASSPVRTPSPCRWWTRRWSGLISTTRT